MNVSSAQSKRWIIAGIAITAGIVALSEISKGDIPKLRLAFGALFAAILLTLLAEFLPSVAAGLAAIIVVGALLGKGSVFVSLTNWIGGSK